MKEYIMKLTTTRNLLTEVSVCGDALERFDQAYPNIDPDQEIDLLDILNNGHNTSRDVIWCLRATVQDSKQVSVDFANNCAVRATAWASHTHGGCVNAADAAAWWATDAAADDVARANAARAAWAAADANRTYVARASATDSVWADAAAEIERQKQDLLELLS
jgi:hypothetical protein